MRRIREEALRERNEGVHPRGYTRQGDGRTRGYHADKVGHDTGSACLTAL